MFWKRSGLLIVLMMAGLLLGACEEEEEATATGAVAAGPLSDYIDSITPAPGNTGVDFADPIVITFSRAMDPTSTTNATSTDLMMTYTAAWSAGSTVLTLTPDFPLYAAETYAVTIPGSVEDSTFAAMGTDFNFSFTTRNPILADGSWRGNVSSGVYKDYAISVTAGTAYDVILSGLADDVDMYTYDVTPPAVIQSFDENICSPGLPGITLEHCIVPATGSTLTFRADGAFVAADSDYTFSVTAGSGSGIDQFNPIVLTVDGAAEVITLGPGQSMFFVFRGYGDAYWNDITVSGSAQDMVHLSDWADAFPLGSISPTLCDGFPAGGDETCSLHVTAPTGGYSIAFEVFEFGGLLTPTATVSVSSSAFP